MERRNFLRNAGLASAALIGTPILASPFGESPPREGDDEQSRPSAYRSLNLQIDVENWVQYFGDVSDYSRLATDSGPTTAIVPANFGGFINIADIVTLNGRPALGTFTGHATFINLSPNPNPGEAIADTARGRMVHFNFEVLHEDGSPVGLITASGLTPGLPPLGAPSELVGDNISITGGTGAYLGAVGQMGFVRAGAGTRRASVTEDPSRRRVLGGGTHGFFLQMFLPRLPRRR